MKLLRKFSKQILTGLVIVGLGGSLLIGEKFLELIFLSILCTAGAGIFIWLGIVYIVGVIGLAVYNLIRKAWSDTDAEAKGSPAPAVKMSSHDIALSNYIRVARAAGNPDLNIRQRLVENGWNPQKVDDALRLST
ncbi:MAG: hypothetical protein OEV74_21545 [Cyclobacteriaceae bacterium]|jgi:hypothetical protein|nr:hypothetical protein [Cyclobacteriaceae bacterium]MDH4298868.1 hypothetical protein [Cyclobacteriaceae bacterium]MDH5250731.1 hypothetical protein [Cyclobacteriaceae bacterium]